ncbi:hypothetical protein PanWU01x14_036680 [Parasponia andersonii]|uniref:Uncharacterized protein n=1 Tax=Parasponia andersonii TaxID=3476 RepID=A0A2P5DSI8_PARAD|nr:hypothetical protein PanWU01x14_036680 [Parasponia andersonii]
MLQYSNPDSVVALSTDENDGVEDATVTILHVNDDEVVAREASDLNESGAEVEEEETIHGFAMEEEFESFVSSRGGGQCWWGGIGVVGGGFGFRFDFRILSW